MGAPCRSSRNRSSPAFGLVSLAALFVACHPKPPPPPPPPPAPVVEAPPPPPPPPPKCEALAEACAGQAGTVARIRKSGFGVAIPLGWTYAQQDDATVVTSSNAAFAVTTYEAGADAKAAGANRDAAFDALVKLLDGHRAEAQGDLGSHRRRSRRSVSSRCPLWQTDNVARADKKGPVLVFGAQLPDKSFLLGAGFVSDDDKSDADKAILASIDSIAPAPPAAAAPPNSATSCGITVTALRLQPGHVLAGKYSIRAALGYAGATASYAAVLASGRPVVVKLFSPQLADRTDVLSALQRAASTTNALPADSDRAHPRRRLRSADAFAIHGDRADPVPSLLEAVRAGPLSPADVALVVRGVGLAVDAAHAQRLAHGGLKPQNVFVGPPGGPGPRQVKVIDFGVNVARVALPTDDGRWVAAPWIAPEQMQGGPDGPASDVFSAGLLAFFAATGRPYWRTCQGPVPDLAGWQQEILAARVPPSARAAEMGVALPPGYDAVLGRALAANPAERYGSITELAGALALMPHGGVVAASAPIAAPAQAMDPPVELPPRSRAGLWIGLALGGLVLIGAAIAVAFTLHKSPAATASGGAPSASAPVTVAPSASSLAAVAEAVPDAGVTAPTASDTENEAAAPEAAQLTVVCMPECDTVTIDDDVLDAGLSDPQSLSAGSHTIVVGKATYLSQTRKVTLKAGQKEKASFFLSKPGPAPTKQCGKFLERCP